VNVIWCLITKGNAYSMEIYLLDLRNAHLSEQGSEVFIPSGLLVSQRG
jgi:hypothetical protein